MNADIAAEAAEIAKQTGNVFIATADSSGMAHMAAAGRLEVIGDDHIIVTEWFCPTTIENLQVNKAVSVVAWDRESDRGYQLLGMVEKIEDSMVLNGFSPEMEKVPPVPQVEEKLVIQVEKIVDFMVAPHSDVVE